MIAPPTETQLRRQLSLPSLKQLPAQNALLIYDQRLEKISKKFAAWLRHYPHRYPVASGERLKDLEDFPLHATKLAAIAKNLSPRGMRVIAVGGGSVGDFAGFFASIYKRGVELVHLPSTWLAAIDSSHGGKTALNAGGAKNQFGTFYPASKVYLCRALLMDQPAIRHQDAMSELIKIALIDGGSWSKNLERARGAIEARLWRFLQPSVEAKMKIVRKDPFEKTGQRQVLNLGHTFGHVLEAEFGLTHGQAVGQGLIFAIDWSVARGLLSSTVAQRAQALLSAAAITKVVPRSKRGKCLNKQILQSLLVQDKKRAESGRVTFIFMRGWGRVERVSVTIDEVISEARRQGWMGFANDVHDQN